MPDLSLWLDTLSSHDRSVCEPVPCRSHMPKPTMSNGHTHPLVLHRACSSCVVTCGAYVYMQAPGPDGQEKDVSDWPMPMLSSSVSAKLRVIDSSCCGGLTSIDAVRSCGQLRVLWMPNCARVLDLSPLAACSETLEELWMACNRQINSLAPLKACTRLTKLGVSLWSSEDNPDRELEVEDLQKAQQEMRTRSRRPGARA